MRAIGATTDPRRGVTNVCDNELADSRYEEINTRFRREIESVWQELKKKC
jgi:hypothetical protein